MPSYFKDSNMEANLQFLMIQCRLLEFRQTLYVPRRGLFGFQQSEFPQETCPSSALPFRSSKLYLGESHGPSPPQCSLL